TGPAIMDGGSIINNWQRCASAADAKGNVLWKDIFYADVDIDISKNFNHGEFVSHRQVPKDKMAPWQRIILCDGARSLLPIAQFPKPKDNFYPDLPADFAQSDKRLTQNKKEGISVISDTKNLTQTDAAYFDGMQIGVHGGNNHVYFASIKSYDPASNQITVPFFKPKTYPTTKYALYNSVRLISEKGEWAVTPIEGGKTRFYLFPQSLEKDQPTNIGFPVLETCFMLKDGASHFEIDGFLIQRYSGGKGAVAIMRHSKRSKDVSISNLEIRFLTGHAGIGPHHCDHITIDNCFIHSCPGWTTAVFMDRVHDYSIKNCLLLKNSGSGIRHYESKRGHIHDNEVLDHYGMHASTLNLYEGCEDVLIENNYLNNVITINRNAKKLTFRNNVVDSQMKNGINLAIWGSGSAGGKNVSDILIENNTFINLSKKNSWGASIFVQGKASKPTGLIIRNNVLDFLNPVGAEIGNNIYINKVDAKAMGEGSQVESDFTKLFIDADKEDYRRKKGGVLENAGAKLSAPTKTWKRK
ncbi:MAG: right-handed parallel beta-helix repeat-containing protein, partial [Planctomycetes bacterium]|nr:right-handed parallel beta-helix repeat-containing protein [Planctomycetota bacterium]